MQLPERFQQGPKSETLTRYISERYSKYGFPKVKHIEYNREWTPEHSRDRYRWVENASDGLRVAVENAGDTNSRDSHTGWYVNNFQSETVHGIVYQLPSRNGQLQYVPAVSDAYNNDCAIVDFYSVTDDKDDAARWADSMAEHYAEREREYQAKEEAKQRLEDIETEIKDEYQDFRRICRELRASCDKVQGVAVVRELVKARWHETKASIRKLRKEAQRIEEYGIEY